MGRRFKLNSKGMTLIELLIALVVVVVVLAAAFLSFSRLFQGFKSQTKVSETHISSLIGFELLRKDIEMAGFGVPYNCTGITFSEAASSPESTYNENGTEVHPFTVGNNAGSGSSDYLVVRSAFNPEDEETLKWAYFIANGSAINNNTSSPCNAITLQQGGSGNFSEHTNVVVEDGESDLRNIMKRGTGADSWKFYIKSGTLDKCPDNAPDENRFYLVYGLDKDTDTSPNVRMPFNRVDYFIAKPSSGSMPTKCESTSYELYRAQLRHSDGKLNKQPILDCVKDFQVAFYVVDNSSSTWQEAPPYSAADQKHKIKEVRLFILYQEGQKERTQVSNATLTLGDNDTGTLSSFSPTGDEVYYHWRVKEISVKPMNLER